VPPVAGALLGRATIDNDATTTQLYLLARVATARPPAEAIRHAVERGIDYLLAAQYPHGGWPQIYPPRNDYTRHVTFNDDAMVNVLELLQEVASGLAPFGWIDPGRRDSARGAVERGVDCIVRAQVKIDGRLTAWCAQHDAATLAPAPARTFEPISLSGAETTGILRFLMSLPDPSPEVQTAVEAGVAWLRDVQLPGVRIVRPRLEDGRLDQRLEPATEGLPVWARFYEIPTQRPIYAGRDAVIRYDLAEVEQERRAGYNYLGHWGQPVLTELYPAWRDRIRRLADL
jgi:PelA/Pel-15E family pectate lyase